MGRSWKLGTAFGIGIFVHWSFLLLPVLVFVDQLDEGPGIPSALAMVGLMLAVFGCVVLHELGHALMARRFGIGTRDITLYPIGGVARLERMSERPSEEFWIALAGPAVNIVIACVLGGFLALGASSSSLGQFFSSLPGRDFLTHLTAANVYLVLFNLLPIFPMDGGRVFRAVLAARLGRLRGTEIAAMVASILVILLPLGIYQLTGAFNPMLLILSFFVFMAGQHELAAVRHQASRRRHFHSAQPVLASTEAGPIDPRFSGLIWDESAQVWVFWRNGRPVGMVAED